MSAEGLKQIHKQNALFRLSEEGEGLRIGAQMRAVISENLLLGEGLKYHKKSRLSARRGEDRSATGDCSVGGGLVIIIISLRRGVKKMSFKFTKSSDYQRGVGIGAQLGAVRSEEECGAGGVGTAQRSGEPPNNRSPTGHTP